jgi:hypothetical protein
MLSRAAYLNVKSGCIYIAISCSVLRLCYIDWSSRRFDVRRVIWCVAELQMCYRRCILCYAEEVLSDKPPHPPFSTHLTHRHTHSCIVINKTEPEAGY